MSKTTRRPSYEAKSLREQTRRFENNTIIRRLAAQLDMFSKNMKLNPCKPDYHRSQLRAKYAGYWKNPYWKWR